MDNTGGKGGVQSVALCLRQDSPGERHRSTTVRLSNKWSALKRGFNQNVGCGSDPSGSFFTRSSYLNCSQFSGLNLAVFDQANYEETK